MAVIFNRPTRKQVWITVALVCLVSLISLAYLAITAYEAKAHLLRAQSEVAHTNFSGGKVTPEEVSGLLGKVISEVDTAHNLTSGPVWWTVANVPFLGRSPRAVQTAISCLDDTLQSTDKLRFALSQNYSSESFKDLSYILGLSNSVQVLASPIKQSAKRLSDLNLSGVPSLLAQPVRKLGEGYAALVPITADSAMFSQIGPALLGLDRPRKWMLVFQNGAEARSIGGFPGGWGILSATKGHLQLSKLYKETALMKTPLANWKQIVTPEQANLYGSDLSRFSDMNLSPDYPTNARLMAAVEEQNFGVKVDGVLSMNEYALADFMKVTGSVKVQDRVIDSTNAASYVTRDVYQDFPNPKQKDQAVFSIIENTFAKFQNGNLGPIRILQAIIPAIHSENLQAWTNESSVQAKFSKLPIGGSLANENNPTAAVVLINGAGNKLDAYVKTNVSYQQGLCATDFPFRDSTITVRMNNTAPKSGLPAYVTTRFDLGEMKPTNPGSTKMLVYIHVPLGSVFESAKINGKSELPISEGSDLARQVWRFDAELPAGKTTAVQLQFAEPALGNEPKPTLWTQSMPKPVQAKVDVGLGCS